MSKTVKPARLIVWIVRTARLESERAPLAERR
jgi:hypothetical protein